MAQTPVDIKVKSEPIDIDRDIKQENELIIESDWLPTQFDEENDYYEEFAVLKNEGVYEKFTIEYLDESGDNDDFDDDNYVESEADDASMETDFDEECNNLKQIETQEGSKECTSGSSILYQIELNKWIAANHLNRECPVCNERLTTKNHVWEKHMLSHKESIEESESNYYISSDCSGVCKKCNQELACQVSRYVHSSKHSEGADKLNILNSICKICNFNSKRLSAIKHVLEMHPEVVKDFKAAGSVRSLKCPLCSNSYIKKTSLGYHIMDKHPHEYKEMIRYECHLCAAECFLEEKLFLQHLIEKHELNSWKLLSFRKVFDDKEYFACTKCNSLFFQYDTFKLLKHFLKHDSEIRWSCKFCCRKCNFKNTPATHMCVEMVRYYEKQKNEVIYAGKIEKKIKNLQEIEKHIAHVCPFCRKEFGKMLKWQHHLRTDHEIDTLKGLEMKVIASDSNKLSCTICHTVVANSPQQLHAHRFQHLPYQPYKCLLCSKTLNTFKVAINHVLKRCKDEDMSVEKIYKPISDVRSNIEIQCSCCNFQKIHDLKSVYKHYEDEHNCFEDFFIKHSDNSITCKICNKKYLHYEKISCFEHLHHHFDEKPFKCKLCLQSYSARKGVSKHLLTVHNAKPLNKQSNGKNSDQNSVLFNREDKTNNVSKIPKLNKASIKTHVLNEFAEFIIYTCPECNEGMTTQDNWYTHIHTQHNFFDESNLFIKDADGSLKCPTCSMAINSITHQQRHKLTHMPYKSFMCNLCYMRCSTLGILYGHFRRRHFAQGTFKCPICPEVLQNQHKRSLHLKEMHPPNEWPANMCLICYKVLLKKTSLTKHMETHDADRFRYTCDVCGAKIIELKDFRAHMNRHKTRGEIKEKTDGISKSGSKNCESNDIEIPPKSETANRNKRKYDA